GAPPGAPQGELASAAAKSLLEEGLKYLEDLHVIEHQHQHSHRQLVLQHLLRNADNAEGLIEAVSQSCAGLGTPKGTEGQGPPAGAQAEEGKTAAEEAQRAAEAEALVKEALQNPEKRKVPEAEKAAVAWRLYSLLNTKCFSRALPPKPQLLFADPNALIAKAGTLHGASSPPTVLAAHVASLRDFRRPVVICIHPKVQDIFLLGHLLLQQMMQLMGRVYQPFTTLGVDTPERLKQHITASQLAPLADQYASQLAKAPLQPPASDGLPRLQSLSKPDLEDPTAAGGFMSLSRFFEESAALPPLLQQSGSISGAEAAVQQKTFAAAAAAAAAAAGKRSPQQLRRQESYQRRVLFAPRRGLFVFLHDAVLELRELPRHGVLLHHGPQGF
ncbi:hypothetical protein, conserved, partial [Eimeria tenella]